MFCMESAMSIVKINNYVSAVLSRRNFTSINHCSCKLRLIVLKLYNYAVLVKTLCISKCNICKITN